MIKKDDDFTPRKIVGLALGILGIVVIFWPMLTFEKGTMEVLGTLSVTMMAVCYAIGTILNRKLLSGANQIDFFANIYNHHVSSFILLFIVSFTFEKWPSFDLVIHNKKVLMSIFYMAFFSTAIAWFLYFYLVKIWSALRASTVSYLIPIMALFWDFLFFKNLPTVNEYVGVIMILIGVFLIQFQLTGKKASLK
jgi:drug/metabolite transporter (DMT)-like permease